MNPVAESLFSTLPKNLPLGVLSDKGVVDPTRLKKCLGFKNEDLKKATGSRTIRFDERMPEAVRQRAIEIAVICELVGAHFDGDLDKTILWFTLPNPLVGGISPRDMVRYGRFKKLAQFVRSALTDV